jgi:hypothetical protein
MCGAMANWYDEAAEELSNTDAHHLLREIGYGYKNERIEKVGGQKFHESIRYFMKHPAKNGTNSTWLIPDDKNRLPVDDIIKDLVQRNLSPRIGAARDGMNVYLRLWGPYDFVRSHLESTAQFFPDFDADASAAEASQQRAEIFDDACDRLLTILNMPFWEIGHRQAREERWSPHSEEGGERKLAKVQEDIIRHQDKVAEAALSLIELSKIARAEIPLLWVNEDKPGRKRQLWKAYFVRNMAHLWILLTGSRPSVSADSPFATFVRECWNSYGENMPQVSFDRAIRNLEILG